MSTEHEQQWDKTGVWPETEIWEKALSPPQLKIERRYKKGTTYQWFSLPEWLIDEIVADHNEVANLREYKALAGRYRRIRHLVETEALDAAFDALSREETRR